MADAIQVASLFGVLSLKDNMTDALESARGGLATFADNLKATGAQIAELGGAMTGLAAPIVGFFGAAIAEASEWSDVMAQQEAVLKSTGGAAGMTADELVNMATAMQNVTRYSDDQIVSGQNLLLTFTNIGGQTFPRATKAMLDMSAAMKQDLKSSAIQLGKALNDPVAGLTALTRVGITFTDAQKDMIKAMVEAGDVAGAQAMILQELEREFGGSAEAAGSTFAGQLDIARRSVEDILQVIGEMLIPILLDLVRSVKPIIQQIGKWISNNAPLVKGVALLAGAMAVLGPVLMVVGGALGAIGTIMGVILSPVGLLVAAIAGLYLAFEENFLGIRDILQPIVDNVREGIESLFGVFGNLENIIGGKGIGAAIDYLINTFAEMFGLVRNDEFFEPIRGLGDEIMTIFLTVASFLTNKVKPAFDEFFGKLAAFWEDVQPGLNALFNWFVNDALPLVSQFITNIVAPAFDLIVAILSTLWDVVSPALSSFFNWFTAEGLPFITTKVSEFMTKIGEVIGKITEWVTEHSELVKTLLAGALVFGIATLATSIFSTAISGVKTAAELLIGKGAMIWDFLHTFAGKVGLVSLAVWALITAFQELQKFLKDLDKMQAETAMAAAPLISQHGITKQQFIDQAWKSSVAELGDPAARLLWGSGIINFQARIEQMYEDALKANGGAASMGSISGFASRVYADYQSHATGLSYVPYDNYPARLHEGERVMTRDENMNGGGGFNNYGNITVIANDPQEFMSKLKAAQVRLG